MALVKVTEASEEVLDWMVALAEHLKSGMSMPDIEVDKHGSVWLWVPASPLDHQRVSWQPSNDWAQSGPIIEREGVWTRKILPNLYVTRLHSQEYYDEGVTGSNHLEAAMRCHVITALGPEVEVPDELLPVTDSHKSA